VATVTRAAPAAKPGRLGADVRALLAMHAVYGVLSAIALRLEPPAKGWAIFGCVVAYNVALPLVAQAVGRADWVALWAFLLPLSVFQVAPDWFLAGQLGTLVFPTWAGRGWAATSSWRWRGCG